MTERKEINVSKNLLGGSRTQVLSLAQPLNMTPMHRSTSTMGFWAYVKQDPRRKIYPKSVDKNECNKTQNEIFTSWISYSEFWENHSKPSSWIFNPCASMDRINLHRFPFKALHFIFVGITFLQIYSIF